MIVKTLTHLSVAAALACSLIVVPAQAGDPVKLEAPVFQTLYKAAVDAKEDQVVFYTSARTEDAQQLSALWKFNFPDIQLTIVGKNAPELITQIEAERAAGQFRADVVTMTQPYVADAWKAKGFYSSYKVSSFDKLAPDYADKDGAYYSSGAFLLPAAYSTRAFSDTTQLPHSLKDFLDPKWKGKIVIAHPSTAGNSLTFFLALFQTKKIDWDYLKKLAAQNVLFVRGNPEAARILASGERTVSPMVSSINVLTSKEKGQKIDFYGLEDGSLVTEQPTGVMAGAPHPTAAKLLLELLTSAKGQELRADAGKYWPTNADAGNVDGLPKLADYKPLKVNLAALSDDKAAEEFLKKFDETFGRE